VKSPDKTTEELAREIKRGFNVEENFRQLFERRYPQIRRFFQRKGFSPEDSYELTQETFLSVYKGLRDFRQESSFDNWMFSIAENIWRSELERRKARKRDAPLVSLDQDVASETDDFSPLAARIVDRSPDQLDRTLESEYVVEIFDQHGQMVKEISGLRPVGMGKTLNLTLDRGSLKEGKHLLKLSGRRGGTKKKLEEYSLLLSFSR
jgi:RNA polymerase sigma-70 factor, ECF subfamily